MTTYAITGASGQLGRLVVRYLLEGGTPAGDIVAIVRNPRKVEDLAAVGVQVRTGDYSNPETLPGALAGIDRLLLVSSSEPGHRVEQHSAVVDAAKSAGVKRIAYTGALNSDTSVNPMIGDHVGTEAAIRASGIAYTFLRNGEYTENYAARIPQILSAGAILGSAGNGRVASASRSDYAEAAAAALRADDADNVVFELGGSDSWTMEDLARLVSEATGTPIQYRDLPYGEYVSVLVNAGVPETFATFMAAGSAGVADGDGRTDSGDLERLIGRPTTPMSTVIRAATSS